MEIKIDPKEEIKVLMQYNQVVYTPGKEIPELKLTEKDPVLDKAVEILKEGTDKIIAQKATMEKAALEKAEQDAAQAKSSVVTH